MTAHSIAERTPTGFYCQCDAFVPVSGVTERIAFWRHCRPRCGAPVVTALDKSRCPLPPGHDGPHLRERT